VSEGRIVCVGEALVDLIDGAPHFGGALANVAVAAARSGGPAELAGGCGDDERGRFLRRRLEEEGVGLRFHAVMEGIDTPHAEVTLSESGEPSFEIHGEGIAEAIATLRGRESELVGGAAAVVVGSNTLPEEGSREVTMAIRDAAVAEGIPLLFDPNLRPGRWEGRLEEARELCLDLARHATLLKLNVDEALWLLGDEGIDAERCAEELAQLGPRQVVVTCGSKGAVARGACDAEVGEPEVEMASPLGAGDVFMGTLAAELWSAGWDLTDVRPALERAAAAGAEACSHLGAFD